VRALSKIHENEALTGSCFAEGNYEVHLLARRIGKQLVRRQFNWRGPLWMPLNFSREFESLQKFHHYYGDDFKVECPAGLREVSSTIREVGGRNFFAPVFSKLFLKGC